MMCLSGFVPCKIGQCSWLKIQKKIILLLTCLLNQKSNPISKINVITVRCPPIQLEIFIELINICSKGIHSQTYVLKQKWFRD